MMAGRFGAAFAFCAAALLLAGCEEWGRDRTKGAASRAKERYAAGDFAGAVSTYEDGLDGSAKTADFHYQLGLIYGDKLRIPASALHHFRRYLELAPAGSYAQDVRQLIKDEEHRLAMYSGQGAAVSQEDAVRLRNENLRLREELERLRAESKRAAATAQRSPEKRNTTEPKQKPAPAGARKYVVQKGDTLFSISRKFFNTPSRWKDIQEANFEKSEGTPVLKPGQTLIIP
jgi:LysM repeat protein